MEISEHRKEYLRRYQSEYFKNNEDQREKRRVRARKNYRKRNPIDESRKFDSLGWYCKCSGITKKELMVRTKKDRTTLQELFRDKEYSKIDNLIQESLCSNTDKV